MIATILPASSWPDHGGKRAIPELTVKYLTFPCPTLSPKQCLFPAWEIDRGPSQLLPRNTLTSGKDFDAFLVH